MRTRIWIVLHVLVVLLPLAGAVLHAPDAVRYGVELPADFPELSLAGWRTEKIQPALQSWFERHIGFRGVMIRTDNSLQTTILRETPPGSYVVIGKNEIYFSRDDIALMSTQSRDLPARLERIAELTKRIGSARKKLAARGKTMVVVIEPSKGVIYPEAIPDRWQRSADDPATLIHDALRSGLEKNEVPFGDADAIFSEKHGAERDLVFAPLGRHWTLVGSCLALHDALAGTPFLRPCEYDMVRVHRSQDLDFDLYRLQNIWGGDTGHAMVPRPRPLPAPFPGPKPRALFAGTSFLWMLVDNLSPFLAEKPIALFYNTTFFDLGSGQRIGPVDPAAPAWAEYVLERDLYVVDILETFAHYDEMFAFITELDRRLN